MRVLGPELTGLIDDRVNAGISDQLLWRGKALDIADLGQDGGAGDRTNAGNGGDVLRQLRSISAVDFSLELLALLFQAALAAAAGRSSARAGHHPESRCPPSAARAWISSALAWPWRPRLVLPQQLTQLRQVKIGKLLGGQRFGQQLA
jgi:hypothetical protein